MTPGSRQGGRRRVLIAAAATALLTAVGATLLVLGLIGPGPGGPITPAPSPSVGGAAAGPLAQPDDRPNDRRNDGPHERPNERPGESAGRTGSTSSSKSARFESFLPGSPPVALRIPSIGVRSSTIVDLGLQDDGTIEVPKNPSAPGWFTPGPTPGQLGPAVIAGHVDSDTGPAVFYRLGQLQTGDRVSVNREDGSVATFVIDRVETFEKDRFPTRAVYGATSRAELRLITCSGNYDDDTGYDSNTIAFAHLV